MFGCCKTFSEKYIFSGNANFRKRKMFPWCLVAFQKISGKYFLVFGKEEGKHKSRKTQATTQEKIINDDTEHRPTTAPSITISPSLRDRDRRRDLAKARSRSSRDHDRRRNLAKRRSRSRIFLSRLHTRSRAVYRDQRRDLATARSRSTAAGMFAGEIAIGADWRSRSRASALSLSLIFRKYFEGKIEV